MVHAVVEPRFRFCWQAFVATESTNLSMLAKRYSEGMHEGMYLLMQSMQFGLDGRQSVCEQTLQYLLAIKNPISASAHACRVCPSESVC